MNQSVVKRNWLYPFSHHHPKAAKILVQFVKFYLFSLLVTLLQYLLLTFLPGIFYRYTDWCEIPCQLIHLNYLCIQLSGYRWCIRRNGVFCCFCHHLIYRTVRKFSHAEKYNLSLPWNHLVPDGMVRGGMDCYHCHLQSADVLLCSDLQTLSVSGCL